MARPNVRGFTLVEMMVAILIAGILTWLAMDSMFRNKPRATLESTAAELQSLVHAARQQALANGRTVAVLVFPQHANGRGTGRIVVLQDEPDGSRDADGNAIPSFFDTNGTPNFADNAYPDDPKATTNGQVIETVDLPNGVEVGPSTGHGGLLPFPYAGIAMDVDCSFCGPDGDRRGAILFDSRGRASFRIVNGNSITQPAGTGAGASVSFYSTLISTAAGPDSTTLVVTAPQGIVRTLHYGSP